jgi:universal stress protein A
VPGVQSEMETAAQQTLDDTLASQIPAGVRVQSSLLEGDPAEQILRFAKEQAVDLIVISTHGHSALERLMFGSVAQKVLRSAPCAVLSIRATRTKDEPAK